MEIIKSISYNQDEIISNIMKLFSIEQFDIDCTYSKGAFYRNIPEPKFKFDLSPQTKDTIKADCKYLPLKNESINSIMFDPPFVIGVGPSLYGNDNTQCKISKRFGAFKSNNELEIFYLN